MNSRTSSPVAGLTFLAAMLLALGMITGIAPKVAATDLYVLETEQLRLIYYAKTHEYLVKHVARCFENSFAFHRALFGYTPSEKVTVFLHDFSDYGNAGAGTVPKNHLSIGIAPFSYAYETTPANERMNATMNHEVVHIVAADQAVGRDDFFRDIFFGKVKETDEQPLTIFYSYLTTPRRSAPRWYHEGVAVFFETWMAGGLGRALGAYDEMVFRTLVHENKHIYGVVGLESEGTKIDFQVGVNSYLYGTRFMSYMALHHGPETLIEWVGRGSGSAAYHARQFKRVYGLSLEDAWSDWIDWERDFQRRNLDTISEYPVTPYRDLGIKTLGSVSRSYYDSTTHKLYAAVNYPGTLPHIAAIDLTTGEIDKICNVKGATLYYVTSLTCDVEAGEIFYTTDNDEWRDLRVVDIATGESETLLKDERVGDLAFSPTDKAIWGVRHFNGISSLVRIPPPYDEWNLMYAWPYGKDVYSLDISPDGSLLTASLAEVSGRQVLIAMDTERLLANDTTYREIHDFGNSIPGDFVFSPDGRYLYGVSYYTGVSNVFRYDLGIDSMEVLSNAQTGFFRPVPYTADSTIVYHYTSEGLRPVVIENNPIEDVNPITFLGQRIVEAHPIVKDWLVDPPSTVEIDSLTTDTGNYNVLNNFGLASMYPIVEGYKEYPAYGMRANLSGPLGLYQAYVTGSYTPNSLVPDDERWHTRAGFSYMSWSIDAQYNGADFYDLFGPTKSSRKGYSLGINYDKSLLADGPRSMSYQLGLTGWGGLERLPEAQNVTTSFDRFISASAKLSYSNRVASLGAVDYEKGYSWSLAADNKYVNENFFPRFRAGLAFGFPIFSHSSVWLRNSVGYSPSPRAEPLANFYFGGFGNNYVDHQSIKRYRAYYSFPGLELNEVGGINFGRSLFEWNLPPIRFSGLGIPSFYATWIRTSLFTTGLVTNVDDKFQRRELANVGGQIDIKFVMLSHLKLTLSLGYAMAFEKDRKPSDEFMLSVKLL